MPTSRAICCWLVVIFPLQAHDFWLQPESHRPRKDETIAIKLFVGDDLTIEGERPFDRKSVLRFQAIGEKRSRDLLSSGIEGKIPFARVAFDKEGTYWIGLERERKPIQIEAVKFNDYLKEEGLDRILDQRRLLKEDDKPGRERYSRYLKSLIQCGTMGDDGWMKTLGHRLEIIPLSDPHSLKSGDSLKVKVHFEGKPLGDVTLFGLHHKNEKTAHQKIRTDAEGIATFRLSEAGPWLLRMVHMRRCPDREEADWESFWTSLSFAVRD